MPRRWPGLEIDQDEGLAHDGGCGSGRQASFVHSDPCRKSADVDVLFVPLSSISSARACITIDHFLGQKRFLLVHDPIRLNPHPSYVLRVSSTAHVDVSDHIEQLPRFSSLSPKNRLSHVIIAATAVSARRSTASEAKMAANANGRPSGSNGSIGGNAKRISGHSSKPVKKRRGFFAWSLNWTAW